MEPREKPKDPNDPRGYTAIPHEGRRVLTGIVTLIVIPIAVFWMALHGNPSMATAHPAVAIASILVAFVMIFALTMTRLGHGIINTVGIEKYVDRNVRGYRLVLWVARVPDGALKLWYSLQPNTSAYKNASELVALILPLGGWFQRPMIFAPKACRPIDGCRVRLVDAPSRLGPIPDGGGQVENPAIGACLIQLCDHRRDRVTVTVWQTLKLGSPRILGEDLGVPHPLCVEP